MAMDFRSLAGRARRRAPGGGMLLAAAAVLAACAVVTRVQTRRVEAENPPPGRFITVDGVRLHVLEAGPADAPPLVLLHGNGIAAQDFELSGLMAAAAERHRVIAFDRPGYGHSDAPPGERWSPPAQAALIAAALRSMGVERALVLGHSWGSLVALALALDHPAEVGGLVLLSGYWTASLRFDVPLASSAALPVLGRVLRHTVSPVIGRALWPLLSWRLFAPRRVSARFHDDYPVWMSLRPATLQASASEAALMIPAALVLGSRLGELRLPVVVAAGAADILLDTKWHSVRLHRRLPGSRLRLIAGGGHMVHHTHTGEVMDAIAEAAGLMATGSTSATAIGLPTVVAFPQTKRPPLQRVR